MSSAAPPASEPPDPMNIGCDARALVGPRTGVGTWTERVMGGLARSGAGPICLAASKTIALEADESHHALRVLPPPLIPTLGPVWLNTIVPGIIRENALQAWVGSLAILPLRVGCPAVAMVHDLTPRTHPERHTMANRLVFRFFFEKSLKTAEIVVAGSAATEDELIAAFPWVEPKLERIGYGVDEWFSPAPSGNDGATIRERFSGGRPYVLHLGTIEPRKGVVDLVAAWESLNEMQPDAPDLVIAGKPGWGTDPITDRIQASPLAGRIHTPGYVSRSDARELLRHAAVFALASEVEGFGLPLAEAVSCGTPAVATDIPALREAGGDAAVFCAYGDSEGLAAALADALEPATAARLRERALERAPTLRWEPIIVAWAELLERVTGSESR